MNIAFACDHAGHDLSDFLVHALESKGHEILDFRPKRGERVDYPDYAVKVARAIVEKRATRGVLVCGTGIGMAMAAGKVEGIRAANCGDLYSARMSRAHNDANILTLGARVLGPGLAAEIQKVFVEEAFEAGRHAQRVQKIDALQSYCPKEPA